jgi:hypothetical protein
LINKAELVPNAKYSFMMDNVSKCMMNIAKSPNKQPTTIELNKESQK